jgi:hypothetical protein
MYPVLLYLSIEENQRKNNVDIEDNECLCNESKKKVS